MPLPRKTRGDLPVAFSRNRDSLTDPLSYIFSTNRDWNWEIILRRNDVDMYVVSQHPDIPWNINERTLRNNRNITIEDCRFYSYMPQLFEPSFYSRYIRAL